MSDSYFSHNSELNINTYGAWLLIVFNHPKQTTFFTPVFLKEVLYVNAMDIY